MFMDTSAMATLRKLELTPTAIDIFSLMVEEQEPGGAVHLSQQEMADLLGIHISRVSRAMGLLVDRGVVVRPNGGKGRRYSLNPIVAGYETEADFVSEMQRQLALGGPPPIFVPEYQKAPPRRGAQLHSVAS
ncbi:ArsR family transcriptional regulator [Streptomyces sp. NPDC047726]|uniref:ArsR family transcriptional regulator n=1 Tax=unclassified Streptomyces TaxID=2593676 RepID=UPI0033C642AF